MVGSMQHETFYASGNYSAPDLGIFAGWVALKGSFADCQPVLSEQDDVALLFSGECFSDPGIRTQLPRSGHHSDSRSAAWLTQLYEKRGDRFFADLNGVFSGLLVDRHQRRAFLFNDRYGMERVYYHEGRDGFFFASEAKALLRVLPEIRAFDDEGLAEFLHYGCTLELKTLFRNVRLLPGAALWSFTGDECVKQRYFVPATWESQPVLTAEAFEAQFHETFIRILPRYFQSESEIGISLTGGLDTRMIMACHPETVQGLTSYTFAGLDGDTLDVRLAARVASACRVPHHVLRIGHDFFSHFASLADRTVYVTDGCFGISGTHEIYLNNLARELAPIRLTGNFGSEILRGVTTFKPMGLSAELLNQDLRRCLTDETAHLMEPEMHPVSFAAFKEIPWHLIGVVRAARSQVNTRTPYLDNDLVALAYQAPAGGRESPRAALSLVRRKHAGLARISTDNGLVPASPLSSLAMSPWYWTSFKLDYWCGEGMPHWLSSFDSYLTRLDPGHRVLGSHKYLQYRRWFRRELRGYLRERLTDPAIGRRLPWNRVFLDRLATDHADGRKNYVREIDAVLTLDAVERLLLRQANPCPLS
jgi:asparagine synthase (glutamine-hydrolysing)